jgi:DNA (cytosine-5)-methyltransferase 1
VLQPDDNWMKHRARLEEHETSGLRTDLNYNIVSQVLHAADYGTPQRRERFFIAGIRADLGIEWSFPQPTHSLDALLWSQWRSGDYWEQHGIAKRFRHHVPPQLVSRGQKLTDCPSGRPWRTVRDAISGLPDPRRKQTSAQVSGHEFIDGARSYESHTGSPLDLPAKTLKAGVHGVPGGENMLLYPNGEVRYFTIRECARLQGFPDAHRFPEARGATIRQLGNAVPVDLAYHLAHSLALALSGTREQGTGIR